MVQIFGIRSGRGGLVTVKWAVGIVGLLILSASHALSVVDIEDDGTPVPANVVRSDEVHSIDSLPISLNWHDHILNADYNAEYGYPEFLAYQPDDAPGRKIHYRIELLKTMEEDVNVKVIEMVSIPAGTFRMGDLSGGEVMMRNPFGASRCRPSGWANTR